MKIVLVESYVDGPCDGTVEALVGKIMGPVTDNENWIRFQLLSDTGDEVREITRSNVTEVDGVLIARMNYEWDEGFQSY